MTDTYVRVPPNSTGEKVDHEGLSINSESVVRMRVQAGGVTKVVNGSFSRPANTTAYAAGDAVTDATSSASPITFSDAAREGAMSGVILGATLIDSANKATKADLELWLFDTAPAADNDNDPFTPSDSELATLIGIIAFGDEPFVGDATADAGGNAVYPTPAAFQPIPFLCPSDPDLYGILVVRNAYTPVSGETFTVRLHVLQD